MKKVAESYSNPYHLCWRCYPLVMCSSFYFFQGAKVEGKAQQVGDMGSVLPASGSGFWQGKRHPETGQ
jgi:hypothetical protein